MARGISPIVATVLMIAVAIAIGVLVTIWITSWVTYQTGPGLTCVTFTNYVIDSVTYYNSTNELKVKITNNGREGLWGFGLVLDNGTEIRQFNKSNVFGQEIYNESNKMQTQHSIYIWVNSTSLSLDGKSLSNEFGLTLKEVSVTNEACPTARRPSTTLINYLS